MMKKLMIQTNNTYNTEPDCIQVGVDLTFIEPRLMDVSSTITARYDAGICKHRLERTGVMVIGYDKTDCDNSN